MQGGCTKVSPLYPTYPLSPFIQRMRLVSLTHITILLQLMDCRDEVAATAAGMKKVIRGQIKNALEILSSAELEERSGAIFRRVSSMEEFKSKSCICLYLSMPAGEVQSYGLLQDVFDNKKRVFIPKVMGKNSEDLKVFELSSFSMIDTFPRSKWGIPEPPKSFVEESSDATYLGLIDCVIMPGVAFDSRCARVGHGKGYYGTLCCMLYE